MENDVTRNHKDALFQLAYKDNPKEALNLYNAMNGSNYTDASKLELVFLDRGFILGMENDESFIFDQTLNVFEQQSTINPNMPLRGLFYFADLYRKIIRPHSKLYGSTLVKIPTPKYVVLYNGVRKMKEDCKLLKLSDAFKKKDETGRYEWTATVLNINPGHNDKLLENCKLLKDYTTFVVRVRDHIHSGILKQDAVKQAVDECISQGIFTDVLHRYKKEVLEMSYLEFDEEEFSEMLREEGREEERKNTLREKERADAAESRADAAERENELLRAEIERLKERKS